MRKTLIARRFGAAVAVASALTFASATASSDEKSATESAIDWYESVYAVSFVEGDPNFYDHYLDHIYLGFGGNVGYHSKQSLETEISEYIAPWIQSGWEQSKLKSVEGVEIDANTVLLTARWSMETADGDAVTTCKLPGWRYVVAKSDATWRVLSEFEAPCAY